MTPRDPFINIRSGSDAGGRMKNFLELIKGCLTDVREIMPWDLEARLEANPDLLIVDVREPYEFEAMHIEGSLNVPRGVLESACEWDYEETVPALVEARDREVVVVCRSGYRSVLAAHSMQVLGYRDVVSLATGLRGWKDYDQPLVAGEGQPVDLDDADVYFTPSIRYDQQRPRR
jgi:rhodanese-related sulfurtransferase